jgi:hypothetical protein
MKAGWVGMVTNVMPNGWAGLAADQHLFSMLGSNGARASHGLLQ